MQTFFLCIFFFHIFIKPYTEILEKHQLKLSKYKTMGIWTCRLVGVVVQASVS